MGVGSALYKYYDYNPVDGWQAGVGAPRVLHGPVLSIQ